MSVDRRTQPGPPWPEGTRLVPPDRFRCRGHVYEAITDPVRDDLPGGPGRWVQITKCLVCEDLTGEVDTTGWQAADAVAMTGCITTVEAEVKRLEGVLDTLRGERVWRNVET